jgi:heptosyltransferase-2
MSKTKPVEKILIIQTAFLGDVVLATSLIEEVHKNYSNAQIHFLVRQGAENLVQYNPHISKVWIWNKKKNKFLNLFKLIKSIRSEKYDAVLNIQRYFSSGLLTAFSDAQCTIGFKSNPLSFLFSKSIDHQVPMFDEVSKKFLHEVQRNFLLLQALLDNFEKKIPMPLAIDLKPKLYFGHQALNAESMDEKRDYVVIAPASIWFTKQWPKDQWIQLIQKIPEEISVFLVGAQDDFKLCQDILLASKKSRIVNTCGKLNLLQTALLMKNAKRVLCNDSAPSHLASAVNAPQTVIFCSTVVEFGFGPLSDKSKVVSVDNLNCRPCGIHGHKQCPKEHFKCAREIDQEVVLRSILSI